MTERYIVKADSAPLPTEAESDECDAAFNEYLRRGGPGWRPSYADAFRAAWFESRLNTLATAGVGAGEGRVTELLRLFVGAAYPVAKEINPRGYNWSEAYLDQALAEARNAGTKESLQ